MASNLTNILVAVALCSLATAPALAATTIPTAGAPAAPVAAPVTNDNLAAALTNGTFWLDARYRYENVHQDGTSRSAEANTLRTIVGYNTGDFKHFTAQIAGLNVVRLSNDIYNDGGNGRTAYPTIGDPETSMLFLANATYAGVPDTTATLGRQKIALDNERFVGAPGWRQIPQTFDGALIRNKSLKDTELLYAYLFHENRSPGTGISNGTYDMSTHLMHAAYSGLKDIKLIGYSYLAAIANTNTLSSATYGVRVEAGHNVTEALKLTGNLEYARQTDYDNNPGSYGLNYYLVEPGFAIGGFKAKFSYQNLGGDGTYAVQTPMMTGHPQDGWADKFSTIPANGLEDAYIEAGYSFNLPVDLLDKSIVTGQWHDFNASHIAQHYGTEADLDFTQNIAKHYAVQVQFADYIADHNQTDTRKVTVAGIVKF